MFGLGLPELLVILVLALIVVGPKRLPAAGAAIGKAIGEMRTSFDKATKAGAEAAGTAASPDAAATAEPQPPTSE